MLFFFLIIFNIIGVFSLPFCKEGIDFCFLCNPVSKLCEKCEKNIFVPNKNGGCDGIKKCNLGISHCLECNEENYLCKKCEEGYFPDNNGGCSYTSNCEISYMGECLKCKINFILIGIDIKICKSLNSDDLRECENINKRTGLCDSCKEGYYLNIGDKKCISLENCLQSSFGICEKCASNYYLDKKEGKCIEQKGKFENCILSLDGKNCDACYDNYYFDADGNCIPYNYCQKLSQYKLCEKCIDNYYLTEYKNSCTKEKKCFSGDKNLGICKQCKTGYYIDFQDGKCKSNEDENDFLYCQSADTICLSCLIGTYLGNDNKCSLSKYCLESEKGKCIECLDNYHLDKDNKCTNIDKCIDVDYTSHFFDDCLECEDDYFFNKTAKECQIQNENLKNCKTSRNGDYCEKCKDNYYLNRTDNLCYNNIEKGDFYKCAYTDIEGEFCVQCIEGYHLGYIDYKCSTVEGCDLSENENKCLKCDSDYYCLNQNTGKCEYNDEINEEKKFYYKCNMTNKEGTACEICIDDYSLNENGLCNDELHCIEKNENGRCKKCLKNEEDYFNQCLNSEFGCLETYIEGCEECNEIAEFDKCTKCFEDYVLEESGECIPKLDIK